MEFTLFTFLEATGYYLLKCGMERRRIALILYGINFFYLIYLPTLIIEFHLLGFLNILSFQF